MVNLGPSLTYHDQNYPDYGPNPDYGSGLHGSGIRIKDRDNFGHDMLKMNQDLPPFYADNFSRDL